jgi:hypothetical protein
MGRAITEVRIGALGFCLNLSIFGDAFHAEPLHAPTTTDGYNGPLLRPSFRVWVVTPLTDTIDATEVMI